MKTAFHQISSSFIKFHQISSSFHFPYFSYFFHIFSMKKNPGSYDQTAVLMGAPKFFANLSQKKISQKKWLMLFKEFSKTTFSNISLGSSSYNLLPRFTFNLLSRYFQTVQLLQLCISSFCSKSGLVKRLLGLSLVKRGSQWHQK